MYMYSCMYVCRWFCGASGRWRGRFAQQQHDGAAEDVSDGHQGEGFQDCKQLFKNVQFGDALMYVCMYVCWTTG